MFFESVLLLQLPKLQFFLQTLCIIYVQIKSLKRMTEPLTDIGLHFDDLNKLRILEPSVALQSSQLKDECKAFTGNAGEFDKITNELLIIVDSIAKDLEEEKLKALGLKNMLQSLSRRKELRKQQLKDLIKESSMELDRLRVQRQSLNRMEQERQDLIRLLVLQR